MNYFIVFDFETDGLDVDTLNVVQLASVTIDPFNLKILENSWFCSDMKPENADDPNFWKNSARMKTVQWHANNQNTTVDAVKKRWTNAPPTELVWKNFAQHVYKYNPKKLQSAAPYFCGQNIKNFDLPIAKRLNEKYKISKLFHRDYVDLMDLTFLTLIWDMQLKSRSMDNLRQYFGISSENAHDAKKDVLDSALLIQRYLTFFKRTFQANKFKGCMKE